MNIFYPYELFAQWITFSVLGISSDPFLSDAIVFFVYDTLKILTLMIIITHVMSAVRYYLPIERIKDILTKRSFYGLDYFLATIFGALTPFCSCSSVPLFIGFLQARIPLGTTFAFMITSPLINEVAIALFVGIFGWQITLLYIAIGITIGMASGFILDKLKMERYVENFVWNEEAVSGEIKNNKTIKEIFPQISKEAFGIINKVLPYIIIGVGIGAFIHGYVPEEFFEKYIEKSGVWGVPIAVLLAIPMYTSASGIIPVIQSLVVKGIPIGTALAFMMAVVGLSLPEAMILKRVLKWRLLAAFFGLVTLGIIITGYILNATL